MIILRNLAITQSKKTIFQTQILKAQALLFLPLAKTPIYVLPNNSNVNWINETSLSHSTQLQKWCYKNVPMNHKRISYIGKVNSLRFGILSLLKLILSFPEDSRPHLDLYGECQDNAQFIHFIHDNHLINKITFHGFVPNPLARISSSDLLILNRAVDHNPNVILEATNIGIPILCSDIPAYWFLLMNDLYRYNIHDQQELRSKVVRFLTDQDFATQASLYCLQISKKFSYNWSKCAASLVTNH